MACTAREARRAAPTYEVEDRYSDEIISRHRTLGAAHRKHGCHDGRLIYLQDGDRRVRLWLHSDGEFPTYIDRDDNVHYA